MYMPIDPTWLKRLNLGTRSKKEFISSLEHVATHPYAHVLQGILEAGASGVFCVDGAPRAAIFNVPERTNDAHQNLLKLYKILWNQGELDFLLILHPDLVEVHSLRVSPDLWQGYNTHVTQNPSPTLLAALDVLTHTEEIESLLSGIESGRLLTEYGNVFAVDARVDTTLIADLEGARLHLLKEEGYETIQSTPQVLISEIHDMLLQAMFLLYLTDRGIIEASYIKTHCECEADSLHALLERSPKDFVHLLSCLDVDFNGGLFTPNDLWLNHATTMANFLEGTYNFSNGQLRLLRVYQFDHIPVELLSEVYDRFLHSEGNKKTDGAYYTPRRLAALVVEQTWEEIKKHIDSGRIPKILDPSCGSGIFLACLFQRISGYLTSPSWDELKHLATCLHGLDINKTAVRISAFSLSLALLNRQNPRELQKHMEAGKTLPELLGNTLQQCDFFNYPVDEQYDYIIGNPPWGHPKQKTKSKGELWVTKSKNSYPAPPQRERSWTFIWKSLEHLPEQGVLALLLPSTGFFLNKVAPSLNYLLNFLQFRGLIDLSALRHVLFKNAIFPACIFHATRTDKKSAHNITYICPKADLNSTKSERIVLAQEDLHLLSAQYFANASTGATQRLMWMTPLERKLLSFIETLPTVRDLPLIETRQARKLFPNNPHPAWCFGRGFQANSSDGTAIELPVLLDIPYVETEYIGPWVHPKNANMQPYSTSRVAAQKFFEGFSAPHIVIPRSLSSTSRLKASYSEHDFSFNDSSMGITVPNTKEGMATGKFLTAILNSSFSAWYTGILGLAVDRPRFTSAILQLPFPNPNSLPNPSQATAARLNIIQLMDALIEQAEKLLLEPLSNLGGFPATAIISKLDSLVCSYMGLNPEEIQAVNESITLIRKAAQPAKGGKTPKLWLASTKKQWDTYCHWLGKALTAHMAENMQAVASPYAYSKDVVIICVKRQERNQPDAACNEETPKVIRLSDIHSNIAKKLEKSLGGNIYLQRCAIVFTEQEIFIVKPSQRRFWLTGTAYADADRIMEQMLLAVEAERGTNE